MNDTDVKRPDRPWTRDELAAVLGVTTRTIDNWIRRGMIPAFRLGRIVRIPDPWVRANVPGLDESRRITYAGGPA